MRRSATVPPSKPVLPTDADFGVGLRWSVIAHAAFFGAILLKSLVFPSAPAVYIPSLRVDLVGLPDQLKQDLKNLGKVPTSKEIEQALKKAEDAAKKIHPKVVEPPKPIQKVVEPAEPDEMVLKPKQTGESTKTREKKLRSALDRIKSLEKISDEEKPKKGATPLIKGNMISKGTSLSGDARENPEANYNDQLVDRLRENWALPVWLARQSFSARVLVFIDARGRLHNYRFVKLSGNAQFDEEVRRTITQSQPYPAPPASLSQSLLVDGILLGFPL